MKRIRLCHLFFVLSALTWIGCEQSESPQEEAAKTKEPAPVAAPEPAPAVPKEEAAAPATAPEAAPARAPTIEAAVPALTQPVTVLSETAKPAETPPPKPGGGERIALLMKARTNPFFDKMASGAEEAAKKFGVSLEVLAIDKETDAEKQAAQVETVTAKGVQAILIAPADSKAIIAPLLQAQARGIKIVNLDNRIDAEEAKKAGLKIEAFIGPDNVRGAHLSTAAMIEKIGARGKVAMLEGIRGVDNAEARKKGFENAVEVTGGQVEIAAMDTGEWSTEPAQKKMESILNAHPDLKGVFCANDMMALGVIQAIASAGKTGKVIVAGYDNLEAAREAIKAGSLYVTIEQHPDQMGALGVENALRVLQGQKIPEEIPVPTDLVMAKDVQ